MPIRLGLIGARRQGNSAGPGQSRQPARSQLRDFRTGRHERRIVFKDVPSKPVPSLNRRFSAPVILDVDLDEDDLLLMMAHDSDPFNRWQAAQTFATRLLIRSTQLIREGELPEFNPDLRRSVGRGDRGDATPTRPSPRRWSPCRAKPTSPATSAPMSTPTPSTWRDGTLPRRYRQTAWHRLLAIYDKTDLGRALFARRGQRGRRALRNACLDLLAAGDPADGAEIAMRQFQLVANMTDQLAALEVLSPISAPQRERALDSFFRSHATDRSVVDKWFSAAGDHPGAGDAGPREPADEQPCFQSLQSQSRLCADRRLRQRQPDRLQRRRRRRLSLHRRNGA